jgi:hypothetical protein
MADICVSARFLLGKRGNQSSLSLKEREKSIQEALDTAEMQG